MCGPLADKGLIRRNRARADRRVVLVSLTATGRQVVDQAHRAAAGADRGDPRHAAGGRGRRADAWRSLRGRGREGPGPPVATGRSRSVPGPASSENRTMMTNVTAASWADRGAAGWLRAGRGGLFLLALVRGRGRGPGRGGVPVPDLLLHLAGHRARRVRPAGPGRPARTCPGSGPAFLVVIPVIGGLLYGPLIYRYAREARGHGVPEVMIAVAENGGRIRPQVSVVKALASALCIGTGGSVGREGPIVQIGSALASSLGQWVRMPENRLRILVACGAGRRHRGHVQRPDHRGFLRRRDHPAGVLGRRAVRRDALGHDRRHHRHPLPGRQPRSCPASRPASTLTTPAPTC